jgi:hypothetical protein
MIVDIVFGKKVGVSPYHVNSMYINRVEIKDKEEIFSIILSSIPLIIDNSELEDDAIMLLHTIEENLTPQQGSEAVEFNLNKINDCIAVLNYLGYVFSVIIRSDLEDMIEIGDMDRVYAMNNFNLEGYPKFIKNGVASLMQDKALVNTNSMVMAFVVNGTLPTFDEEIASVTDIQEKVEEYLLLEATNETALMDASDLILMYESLGYNFMIILNPMEV